MSDVSKTQPVAVPSVVWGVIVLIIAVSAFVMVTLDIGELGVATIVWAVIGLGALLIVAAVVGAVARAAGRASTDRLTDL